MHLDEGRLGQQILERERGLLLDNVIVICSLGRGDDTRGEMTKEERDVSLVGGAAAADVN